MLKLVFGGRWYVQLVLSMVVFALAGYFYVTSQEHEAEKARARAAGMPAAVSLSAFDPAKDVHAANEVHVTGWINPEYNYQLTEEHRKRSDVVRRMFVLFGPEDAPDSKVARAVVLMHEDEIDQFMELVVAGVSGQVAGNPVFSLNGEGKTYATLDNMADEALAEKGLKKAPGFRYIEMWPQGSREAGLAPDPSTGSTIAMGVAGFGVVLLLIAGVKFSRRNSVSAQAPAAVAAPAGFAGMTLHGAASTASPAAMAPHAPAPAAKKRGILPAPNSFAFLGLAMLIGMISTWTGHWQLMVLAFGMGVFHFVMRVKVAMDKGVATVASALTQGKDELSQMRAADPALAGTGPVTRSQSPVEKLMALGQTTPGKKVVQVGLVVAILMVAPIVLNDSLLKQIGTTVYGESSGMATLPASLQAETTQSTKPTTKEQLSPEPASISASTPEPEKTAVVQEVAAETVSGSLIPEAASLQPGPGETGAPAPLTASPVVVAEAAVPAEPAMPAEPAVPAEAPVEAAEAPAVAPVTATEAAPEEETLAAAVEAPEPSSPGFLAGFSLGSLLVIAPIIGAVCLAIAAFALMRGRQAEPPQVFAGRDPWGKLANEARSTAGA